MYCQSEIFKALERAKLLVGSRKDSCYSRCGRTDKGVSATGQVPVKSLLCMQLSQMPDSNEQLFVILADRITSLYVLSIVLFVILMLYEI